MKTITDILNESPDLADADAIAAYNAQVEYRRVPIAEVNFFLIDRFLNGRLRLARDNPQMPTPVRAFLGDFLIGTQTAQSVDGTSPTIRGAIAQVTPVLVTAQVMTQAEADAFTGLLRVPLDTLTADDVARARRAIAANVLLVALETYASAVRTAVNEYVASGGTLPEVP